MTRLSRVNHKSEMRYKNRSMPRHTPVSMSQYDVLYNKDIFEDRTSLT